MSLYEDTNVNPEVEEEESSLFTVIDDDGEEATFEYLGEVELSGKTYLAVIPDSEEYDDDVEVIFLEVVGGEDEETFETVEDEELLDTIFDLFKAENSDIYDFE